ncbi:hypothetical protein [Candidatus Palauibacter sp.]|uniref:hypothetical protein n=1 Tax=Candidatus Palauibacter sp. TaxID=3101350 RepID=UPI003B02B4E7
MIQSPAITRERNGKPSILVVDDLPDQIRNEIAGEFGDKANLEVLHPSDMEASDLARADLVLVDYKLEHWPKRDDQKTVFKIQTGLALAAVLRELLDEAEPALSASTSTSGSGSQPTHLTSVALHTQFLDEAKGRIRLPGSSACHVLARLNNLEWTFEKGDASRIKQMLILARSTRRLPAEWPNNAGDSDAQARDLLGLENDVAWYGRCWRDVRECQPPIHELAGGAGGVLFLRWLLHQILPFPSFLWDEHWVAARLRLQVDDLRRLLKSDNELRRDLSSRKYSGLLEDFLGDRWWRGAIEDYAWELADGSSGDSKPFRETLLEKAGENLKLVELDRPVVCLDENLQPSSRFASPSEAVNVRPDHWPAFADSAWMRISTVTDVPEMRAIVDPLDDYRLPTLE